MTYQEQEAQEQAAYDADLELQSIVNLKEQLTDLIGHACRKIGDARECALLAKNIEASFDDSMAGVWLEQSIISGSALWDGGIPSCAFLHARMVKEREDATWKHRSAAMTMNSKSVDTLINDAAERAERRIICQNPQTYTAKGESL